MNERFALRSARAINMAYDEKVLCSGRLLVTRYKVLRKRNILEQCHARVGYRPSRVKN